MKIKCSYCGSSFDDYLAQCPNCGAPNEGVVRTASDQPLTIEELKKWYVDRGLPPYETTRFFIGIDYKAPRAFGIYKEPETGIVTVYKNKDTGERAVRYRGTDEAYAVNELFQRLKQEIIQQKMNNVKKGSIGSGNVAGEKKSSRKSGCLSILLSFALWPILGFIILFIIGIFVVIFTPEDGYYRYDNVTYYYDDAGYKDKYVFEYNDQTHEWRYPVGKDEPPYIFKRKQSCKKYYLSAQWDPSYNCTDINTSEVYKEFIASANILEGYYSAENEYFYHYGSDYDTDWYYYNDYDWMPIASSSLPESLSKPSAVTDFYYTPTWDGSTQFSDFTQSSAYQENYASSSSDDSDYDWSSSDSWDSGSTDFSSDW